MNNSVAFPDFEPLQVVVADTSDKEEDSKEDPEEVENIEGSEDSEDTMDSDRHQVSSRPRGL